MADEAAETTPVSTAFCEAILDQLSKLQSEVQHLQAELHLTKVGRFSRCWLPKDRRLR